MADGRVAVKIFGITQGVILVALIVAIILYKKRQRENVDAAAMRLDGLGIRESIKRTQIYAPDGAKSETPPGEKPKPAQLESSFPSWDSKTAPHEILGIHPSAPEDAIEKAYKSLLKKYHPDRFASWGKGYQNRAHHTILLIQDARDRMLGKKS